MEGVLEHIAMLAQSPHAAELRRPLTSTAVSNKKRAAASLAPLQVQMKRLRTQERPERIVHKLVQELVEHVLFNTSCA